MRQWQQIKRKTEKEMDRGHSQLDWFGHQHSSEAYRRQTQMASYSAHRQPSERTALDDDGCVRRLRPFVCVCRCVCVCVCVCVSLSRGTLG